MAYRRELVLDSGNLSEISDGEISVESLNIMSLYNSSGIGLLKCTPVYRDSPTGIGRADNGSRNSSFIFGLVFDPLIDVDSNGKIATSGVIEATTGEWDTITNGAGGLTPGQNYFLGSNGALVTTPDMNAHAIAKVGVALSSTRLKLLTERPIFL